MSAKPWVIGILLVLGWTGCGRDRSHAQPSARWVRVAHPQVRSQAEAYPLTGTVVPEGAAQVLSFLVPGRVTSVRFREGERIARGQVLANLEATSCLAALEASAAQTRAAQAAAERAQDECRRMRILFERQSLAENDFLKYDLARRAAEEQLQQARANETSARKALADTWLKAPGPGVVIRRLIEPGLTVAPGQPAFEVAALGAVEIQVGLPENLVNAARVGQKAQVVVPAVPGGAREGTLRIVNAAVDPASRTYMARVAVPNPGGLLRLGMVAEVRIQGDAREDLLVVPCDAVVQDPQGVALVFEFRPAEGRVVARRVEVGRMDGQGVQIRSGVDASTWIVVAGQHALRDGNPVQVATGAPLVPPGKE